MTDTISEEMTVRDILVAHPATRRTLERLGIDYCCGGHRSLREAAQEAGADVEEVLAALRAALRQAASAPAQPGARPEPDWQRMSVTDMANHIERKHHAFMKEALPRLEDLLGRVRRAHQERHGPMLGDLTQTFSGLRAEIEVHLVKEEQVLFPYLRRIEAYAQGRGERPPLQHVTVANPIAQMRWEHERAGAALARMRGLTEGYALPPDACESFRALYEGLQEMEDDLHQHIHLENNILFPRAIELEAQLPAV